MRLASFALSCCLHAGFALLAWFLPGSSPISPDSTVRIVVVEGLPGGNRAPSPILGPQGAPGKTLAPPMPAPSRQMSQPLLPEPAQATPVPMETPPAPKLEPPKPAPKPEPEPDAVSLAAQKKPEPPKPEPPKEEAKKNEPKKTQPPKADAAKAYLDKLRAAASKSPQGETAASGAVDRALAQARKNAGGRGGGGGGEGEGESGGGLLDVYRAQIIMAVRPNWAWPGGRGDLAVDLFLRMDTSGQVLEVRIEHSSGNAIFDSTAITAVRMTGNLPSPPPEVRRDGIFITFTPE